MDRNAAFEQNVFARPPARVTIRRRRSIFPSTRPPARVRSATARPENGFRRGTWSCRTRTSRWKGAIQPWRRGGQADEHLLQGHAASVAAHFNVSLETPWKDLPEDFKKVLLHGSGEDEVDFKFWRAGKVSNIDRAVRRRAAESGTAGHRERKRIHPQPAQGLHEPAVLRRLRRQAAQAGNSGRDARRRTICPDSKLKIQNPKL